MKATRGWSTVPEVHEEMKNKIYQVTAEKDKGKRFELAIRLIAESAAYYSEPIERVGSWASVMAMAALYPETYMRP